MKMMKQILIPLFVMGMVSVLMLIGLSVLTYIFKWQADTALVGITFIYIVTGFIGGHVRKNFSYETNMGKKLIEGIVLGAIFVAVLVFLSFFVIDIPFEFSGRFLMIWMLLSGSAALGRIL